MVPSQLELPPGSPFTVRTDDGAVISGRAVGSGQRLVVLAHGWTNDSRVWSRVVQHLVGGGHRVVVYDQRGHGASTIGASGLTLSALAGDLAAVLAHVEAGEAVVAGHSMGGMALQTLAAEDPGVLRARARALVLVSTACDGLARYGTPFDRLIAAGLCRLVGSRSIGLATANGFVGPLVVRPVVGVEPDSSDLRTVGAMFAATPARVRRSLLAAMQAMDLGGSLGSLDMPVLVVSGSDDVLTPPARSCRITQVVPQAHQVLLPGTGHMLPLEEPDVLASLLAALGRGLAPAEAGRLAASPVPGQHSYAADTSLQGAG